MILFQQRQVFGLLVPALRRRTHITAYAAAREWARSQTTDIKPHRRHGGLRTLGQALRIGRDVLFTVWGVSVLAFWLVAFVGFLR
jgi:hypothetical protein